MVQDLSAPFPPESFSQRLRRLADVADGCGISTPDVYGAASELQNFESEVAELLGKERGLFFATGTLAQRASLHAHCEQLKELHGPNGSGRIIVHPTSHLVHHDCLRDGQSQAKRARVEAAERLPLFAVELAGKFHCAPTADDFLSPDGPGISQGDVVVVELPQRMNGGRTMAWADLLKLSTAVRDAGARLHMDGARLWEVQPFYGQELKEICKLFDSVYVSFYKGLGGMNGAMLCSGQAFIKKAAEWRTRLGGSLFTSAPHWLDAREQLRNLRESFDARFRKLKEVVKVLSADPDVKKVLRFEPPVPQACLVHGYVKGTEQALTEAHSRVREQTGISLWNGFRGPGYAADASSDVCNKGAPAEIYFELNMGPANAAISSETFLTSWRALAKEIAP
eukprot:TRINITY_DN110182_c0_g1_i1.p1 TRINITY_DN110182_c0_g1~~TRINITY_DN110182_c0_g1_i1.p1  ORF type:complete len:396 (-),score=71.51 TRINITY_DN110182_c0_g1_i1:47-1234(-)